MRLRALLIATAIVIVLLIILSFVRLDGETEAPSGAGMESSALDARIASLHFVVPLR